jgi:uncharacterized membrane protein YeiH
MGLAEQILYVTELLGTVAFALSGAMVGVKKDLDLLGIIVLGVTAAVGGGALRDIMIGQIPPVMFRNSTYVIVAFLSALAVFLFLYFGGDRFRKYGEVYTRILNFVDAVGLGVFAAAGARAAIQAGYGDQGFLTIFVGALTGVGGGMLRDLMATEIPMVLKKRIYAVAAVAGAWLYWFLYQNGVHELIATYMGVASVIAIRMLAAYFCWDLPKIPKRKNEA